MTVTSVSGAQPRWVPQKKLTNPAGVIWGNPSAATSAAVMASSGSRRADTTSTITIRSRGSPTRRPITFRHRTSWSPGRSIRHLTRRVTVLIQAWTWSSVSDTALLIALSETASLRPAAFSYARSPSKRTGTGGRYYLMMGSRRFQTARGGKRQRRTAEVRRARDARRQAGQRHRDKQPQGLLVGGEVFQVSVGHEHREVEAEDRVRYRDCAVVVTIRRHGARGRLRVVFQEGRGILGICVGYGWPGTVVATEGGRLNLAEPGTKLALLAEARKGWVAAR